MKKKILYKKFEDHIPVDINQLRPNKSYDNLISIDLIQLKLIEKHGQIPSEYLQNRSCLTPEKIRQ